MAALLFPFSRPLIPGFTLLALIASVTAYADFVPPSPAQAVAALGPLDDEPTATRRLLTPDDDFAPIEAPAPGDWLASHPENGQTYADFVLRGARPVSAARRIIYLQPLGEFNADSAPALEALRDYAEAFFQLDVVLLPAEVYESAAFEPRINPRTQKLQLRTTAILTWLHARLPEDGFCLVAVTMSDLYPAPSWNFVFGQAAPQQRTGVFSFARSDPLFFGQERQDDFDSLLLRRSCKTLVHEIAHLFGLHHCIYYRCVENGSNHQAESDARPHHLCPVCLRKLQHATGADLERRYRDLAYFYSQHSGWDDEEAWVRRQLAKLRSEPVRPQMLPRAPLPDSLRVTPPVLPPSPPLLVPPGGPDDSGEDPQKTEPRPAVPQRRETEPAPTDPEPPPVSPPVASTEPLVAARK